MRRALPFVAVLLVAACDRQEQAATPAPDAVADAPTPPAAKAPVPSLEGAWTVGPAGGGDASLTLTLKDGKATMAAGCVRRGFTYKQDGNSVAFASDPADSSNCGGQSPSARQEAASAALVDANLAVFGKDGGEATLTGLGGPLSLERR